MRLLQWLRDQRGTSLVDTVVMFAILAVAVPGMMGWMALTRFSDADSRALLKAVSLAETEMVWLQANCPDQLRAIILSTPDAGQPTSCQVTPPNYPKDTWREPADAGVPGFAYQVQVAPLTGEEDSYDLALVQVTARWQRAFLVNKPGERHYLGFLLGSSEEYWEDYAEWLAR